METRYIVYTISLQGKVMYVGSTNNFERRKGQHKTKRGTNQSAIPMDVDLSLVSFNIIVDYESKKEALKEEDRLIVEYDTINNGWNKQRSGLIRSNGSEYLKKWYIGHNYKEYHKNYRLTHNQYIKEYKKEYYKKYRLEHRDEINAKRREWRKRKKEVM